MKSLFECQQNETRLELGVEDNNCLTIRIKDKLDYFADLELDLQEALVLQGEINKYLEQIKAKHRSQLPWHKQFGI
jgi:hypothetical protein